MTPDVFDRYGTHYDLLYRDKDYKQEADYVARLLRASRPDTRTLLEFGIGTGRHAELLTADGFKVVGVERSKSMLMAARRRGLECVQGDIRTVRVDRTFDAVIALFHVMSYQATGRAISETFANAARHLPAQGVFLFDVWHGPAVIVQQPSVRVKQAEDKNIRLTRTAEPRLNLDLNQVTVHYTMQIESKTGSGSSIIKEDHRIRYFFPVEIDAFAKQSGFDTERTEEFVTGNPPSEATWGVCYLLRKRA
jgi:SAM-dependent methyltransferase